ncbi:ABC transporter ATP-binding protein [Corynebacterium jeikeium]|uniref:ABC transporter ATP-binding protein n=1 Tax=Corynebacterium jeikeium TaxID=38289 RepID=UPI001E2B5191|nr:ABC transporter ATP-binding protein [Corynebacterium jeikeium]
MFRVIQESARRHRWLFTAVVVFTVLLPAIELLLPLLAGASVDGSTHAIGLLVLAACARFITQALRRFLSGTFSVRTQHSLRTRMFEAIQSVDEGTARSFGTGQVISRTITDLTKVQGMVAMLPLMASSMLELVLIFAVVLWISPPIAGIIALQIPLLFVVAYASRKKLYAPSLASQRQAAVVAEQVDRTVSGVQVMKSFAQEPREIGRYRLESARQYGINMHVGKLSAIFQPALSALPNVALVAAIALGGWLAMRGAISVGDFLAVSTYITMLARLTRMAAGTLVNIHVTQPCADRILEIIDAPPRPTGTTPVRAPMGFVGSVPIAPGQPPVRLSITPSSTTIVEGPVASGKTRLAHALAGLNTQDAVDIRVMSTTDGMPIPLLEVQEADRPALVMDEAFLYSGTIRENILLGYSATEAEVWEAARLACADQFIREAGGLDTVVGERGITLSGGQRQRIAIARVLLRTPHTIIFDDATSAIDQATESQILANLRTAVSHPTVIYISHRADGGFRDPDQTISLPAARPMALPEETPAAAETSNSSDPANYSAAEPRIADLDDCGGFRLRTLFAMVPGLIAAVVVTLFLSSAADIALPTFIRHAIDGGVAENDIGALWVTCGSALMVVALSWGAQVANTVLTTLTGERLIFTLRNRLFRHITGMDLLWFHSQSSGRIMTRLTTDIDSLSNFLQSGLSQTIVSTSLALGILGMLISTDLTLAGIVALFLPVIVVVTVVFRIISRRLYTRARSQISQVNATFQEALMGLPTGQAFGYGTALQTRLENESREYLRLRIRSQTAVSLYFPGINLLTQLAQAAILSAGGTLVANGQTTEGALVAFSLYLTMLFGPIQQLSQVFDQFQQASVSVSRIRELLNERPAVTAPTNAAVPAFVKGPEIRCEGVVYKYRTINPCEHSGHSEHAEAPLDIDHTFRGTTAVVGATGAGKTTLLRLINRFMDPTEGTVRADGTDIQAFDVRGWRRCIGTVPQEPHMFAGTVAENIAYGADDGSQPNLAEVKAAVGRIGGEKILQTIPGGLSARISPEARTLSSGQKHMIALARAEYIQPAVMLLDEATANISDDEEAQIVEAINRVTRNRTALIVAHRLRTAARADTIVVMDHGRIVEIGEHNNLLQNGGLYAELWNAAPRPTTGL